MRTLLVGNTGYITNKFVEEAFPESLVMVMGDTNIRKNRKKNAITAVTAAPFSCNKCIISS